MGFAQRYRVLLVAALIAAAGIVVAVAGPSTAAPRRAAAEPVTAGSYYLALGDSIPFGYREPTSEPAGLTYTYANKFVGFPAIVGSSLGLKAVNAACPGETSASFIHVGAQSDGCESAAGGNKAKGYRSRYPLHQTYTGSQLGFAESFLKHHPGTRLVTLMIGAGDAFACQATTADACAGLVEQDKLKATIKANVHTILAALRHKAGYRGQIVVSAYFPTKDATVGGLPDALTTAVDDAQKAGAAGFDVSHAAINDKFQQAADGSVHDNACEAGLLTRLSDGGCGVDASVTTQVMLADRVIVAIRK